MFRKLTRTIAATASLAVIGLFAVPQVAHAANVDITITGADGTGIGWLGFEVAMWVEFLTAIAEGREPATIVVPDDRFARANVRVAVRQLRASGGPLPALAPWIAAHDHGQMAAAEIDDTETMHR